MATVQKTVKQLAIEKGLYRQRGVKRTSSAKDGRVNSSTCSSSSTSLLVSKTASSSPLTEDEDKLSYLIVIDFESTCWPDGNSERYLYLKDQRPQEIIEFPSVLVDLSTGHVDVENSFQYYVQPEEQPTLSAFCTRLTGISQTTVDNGVPLRAVLPRFNTWLKNLKTKHDFVFAHHSTSSASSMTTTTAGITSSSSASSLSGKNLCSIATWTDWDLGRMLYGECKRKGLRHPPELAAWVDLKLVYKDFYGRKPSGLNGALKDAGIVFDGREHSGIDDAVNTAKLAVKMSKDGCDIRQTKGLHGILTKK